MSVAGTTAHNVCCCLPHLLLPQSLHSINTTKTNQSQVRHSTFVFFTRTTDAKMSNGICWRCTIGMHMRRHGEGEREPAEDP